jgi:hypothetical protein
MTKHISGLYIVSLKFHFYSILFMSTFTYRETTALVGRVHVVTIVIERILNCLSSHVGNLLKFHDYTLKYSHRNDLGLSA